MNLQMSSACCLPLVAWSLALAACSLPPTTGLRDSASHTRGTCAMGGYNHIRGTCTLSTGWCSDRAICIAVASRDGLTYWSQVQPARFDNRFLSGFLYRWTRDQGRLPAPNLLFVFLRHIPCSFQNMEYVIYYWMTRHIKLRSVILIENSPDILNHFLSHSYCPTFA